MVSSDRAVVEEGEFYFGKNYIHTSVEAYVYISSYWKIVLELGH